MPTYTKYAQLRTPLGPEADDVPGDLQQLADGIDPLLNLLATDESDRDARYGDAPVGTLVSLTAKEAVYRKGLSGWVPVWTGGGWLDLPVTPSANWTDNGSKVKANGSGAFELLLAVIYNGSQLSSDARGNYGDTNVITVPAEYCPPAGTRRMGRYGIYTQGQTGSVAMAANGTVYVMDGWPSSTIESGSSFTISLSGMMA